MHPTAISRSKLSRPMRHFVSGSVKHFGGNTWTKFPNSLRELVAINAAEASPPLRFLDYGCGRGGDVSILREEWHDSSLRPSFVGYDPASPGWDELPQGKFDIVTCIYVLNIIENYGDVVEVIRDLVELTIPGGRLFVATRSAREVNNAAHKARWSPASGGGWRTRRGTYQRGWDSYPILDEVERVAACMNAGFRGGFVTKRAAGYTGIILTRTH